MEIYYQCENGKLKHSVHGTCLSRDKIQDQIDDGRIEVLPMPKPIMTKIWEAIKSPFGGKDVTA